MQIDRKQATSTVIMVIPSHFGFNPETAETNVFQNTPDQTGLTPIQIRDSALKEFTSMVDTLKAENIEVLVLESKKGVTTPDAIFPNNWFSHHQENILVFYPMLAPNRRLERQPKELITLLQNNSLAIPKSIDFTFLEDQGEFLEGTGSMVLDREHCVAFAMESPRTHKKAFNLWCKRMHYEGFFFHAYDKKNLPIYHTNVVMSIGESFAVYAKESIPDKKEQEKLEEKLASLGKECIPLTLSQIYNFCANILQVETKKGDKRIILSTTAYTALTQKQKDTLTHHGTLVPVAIPTIEKIGGGSARCMLAEIFR